MINAPLGMMAHVEARVRTWAPSRAWGAAGDPHLQSRASQDKGRAPKPALGLFFKPDLAQTFSGVQHPLPRGASTEPAR